MWQNSKTQNVTQHKKTICYKTYKNVTKLKNLKCGKTQEALSVIKLKNLKCDKSKKKFKCDKSKKKSNCNKTH